MIAIAVARKGTLLGKEIDVDEVLTDLEKLVDRLRVMYEQYFLGIRRAAPSHMHSDAERRMRDLAQLQIRNTGQRYRFATLSQKFGSYNSYWKRTVREIESGRYIRDLSRIQRQSARSGENIPEEVLAAMPKRMREMIERDRRAAEANAKRRGKSTADPLAGANPLADANPLAGANPADKPSAKPRSNTHSLGDSLLGDDLDLDAIFKSMEAPTQPPVAAARTRTGPRKRPTSVGDLSLPRTKTGETKRARKTTSPSEPSAPPARTSAVQRAQAPMFLSDEDDLNLNVPATTTRPPPPRAATLGGAPHAPPTQPPPSPAGVRLARPGTSLPPPPPPPGRPVAPPSARATSVPAPTAAPPPGMSEADTRALYAKYVKAREMVRDSSETMSYDRMVRHLRQQAPKIMETHKASGVEFGIVIKDNKIVIKAKPKP